MKDYQRMNLRFSLFYTVVCLLFSVSFYILDWQWLATVNYRLHEMFGLPILMGYFLVPLGSIAGLVLYYQYHRKTDKSAKKPINTLLNFVCAISFVLCVLTFSYFSGRISTSGVEQSLSKYETDNRFYIYLNNSQVEVSEQQYNSLEDNAAYLYSYYHGEWVLGKYSKLEYIKGATE